VGEVAGAPNIWLRGPVRVDSPPFFNPNGWTICGNAWADETNGDNWLQGNSADGTQPGSGLPFVINSGNMSAGGFFSFHPGQCNFLYADGHVATVNESVDIKVVINSIWFNDGNFIPQ
jgi:prepilin-type processing-associated H-X9-DG protein